MQPAGVPEVRDAPRGRVIIADDDAAIRGLMTAAVSKAGADLVAAVADGAAAVAAVTEHSPDLVLLDVSMPVLSGIEACRQLRAHGSEKLLIVLLSAAVHPAAVAAGLAAGADVYLEKPFSPRALAARLRELLLERAT